jgi:lipoate-protein ligase A
MLHLISLENTPILEQLQLEEALLRTDERSFCLINRGSPPAIVMGISGQAEHLVDLEQMKNDPIPLIRRFSGGGTVVVDENTLFITFIINKKDLDLTPFPEPILRWSADLYTSAWQIPNFHLRENDYAIGDKKCGGNAQYLKKDRWVHHTSFLWDFKTENMNRLLMPQRRPSYRKDRVHTDFLCRLKDHSPEPKDLISSLKKELVKRFYIKEFDLSSWQEKPHRQATHLYDVI